MKHKITKEQLQHAASNSLSIAEVCRLLNIRPVGGNHKTVKKRLREYCIDTSHFTGSGWNTGKRYKPIKKVESLDTILVENSQYTSTYHLKTRLLKEGILQAKCECCGLAEWMGEPIPTELDHINGINTDHRLENLRILCPNCHSQTPTFRNKRGKAKLSALSERREVEYRKFREGLTANPEPSL